jgi:hypothetical protein
MIITKQYFIGDLYIPSMKPSITDEASALGTDFTIEEYSKDCLVKSFGFDLFLKVVENLEVDSAKSGSEQKWKDLIDGEIVTLDSGVKKQWKGLAYKNIDSADAKNKSFIANYVYFFNERKNFVVKSGTGDVELEAANAINANPGFKASIAYNAFVDEVVGAGNSNIAKIGVSDFGEYVDWYCNNNYFSLYEFINYKNGIDPTTYPNFSPHRFSKINSFGI